MIDEVWARDFAERFAEAFNKRDIATIGSMFAPDAEMKNPLFSILLGIEGGIQKGRDKLINHFEMVFEHLPHTRYKVLGVFVGLDSLALHVQTVFEKRAVEFITFDDKKLILTAVTHYDSLSLPGQ